MPFVYVLLGGPAADLADLTRYLLREGFDHVDTVDVLAAEDHRATLGEHPRFTFWPADEALPETSSPEADLLILPPAAQDPRPFLEDLRGWLDARAGELGRIISVVDCAALAGTPSLNLYYDLCLHFSDVFLLGNRADISKKWIREYQNRLHKMAVPTLIDFLKKGGRVDDVKALLYPETRRVSQFFDPADEDSGVPVEIEGFGAEEETEDLRDAQDDPYLERGEDGQYVKKVKV